MSEQGTTPDPGLHSDLEDFAQQIADQVESFLVALRAIARENDGGRAISLLLLEISQVLLAGARLGAEPRAGQEDLAELEQQQRDRPAALLVARDRLQRHQEALHLVGDLLGEVLGLRVHGCDLLCHLHTRHNARVRDQVPVGTCGELVSHLRIAFLRMLVPGSPRRRTRGPPQQEVH